MQTGESQCWQRLRTNCCQVEATRRWAALCASATVVVPRNDTSSYFHFIAWAADDQVGIQTMA